MKSYCLFYSYLKTDPFTPHTYVHTHADGHTRIRIHTKTHTRERISHNNGVISSSFHSLFLCYYLFHLSLGQL